MLHIYLEYVRNHHYSLQVKKQESVLFSSFEKNDWSLF